MTTPPLTADIHIRRICLRCGPGEHERMDATHIKCASCSAVRLDDEAAVPRQTEPTEAVNRRVMARPRSGNGHTPAKTIKQWQEAAHALATSKGWHTRRDGSPVDPLDPERIASRLANIHAELSEALDAVAHGQMAFYLGPDGKPEGFGVELADVFIRLCDLAESVGVDIDAMAEAKHKYHRTRPRRHGGKRV